MYDFHFFSESDDIFTFEAHLTSRSEIGLARIVKI